MALIKVKMLDYNAEYTYGPPQVDAIINEEDVVSAVPTEARGAGPFLRVNLRDGTHMVIAGSIEDILAQTKGKA